MKTGIQRIMIIVLGVILGIGVICVRTDALIKPGDAFPGMSFDLSSNKKAQEYLGIRRGKTIELSQIDADLLIVEVMSVYCVSCMSQTAYDRELFTMIEGNNRTAGKVKMIGIGAGNNLREVNKFVEEFDVPYPVFPDFEFSRYNQVGQVRTPFKIFMKKKPDGTFRVIETEQGAREDVKRTFGMIVAMLDGRYSPEGEVEAASMKLKEVDQDVVEQLLKEWLDRNGETLTVKELFEESGMTVYKIGSKEKQFAVLVNRVSTCDVCKEVQFLYIVDRLGNVRDIIPIHLSKLYNETFNEEDVSKIKGNIIARNVRETIPFNPAVDAVSSATITSGLMYDSINKGALIYRRLIEKGFI
ncbi:MAG: TlpA family protein disulfide reductase [bacterium]